MELRISDLLDDLTEVPVSIQPNITASPSRIKELTMKKVREHGKYEAKRRGIGLTRKLLIAAVLVTAMAVPVMAVSGGWFSDWLAVTEERQESLEFHWKEAEENGSKNWDISGWYIEMLSEEVTSTGMTLVCHEFSNDPHTDKLTTNDSFWLEKWNGTDYEKMEAVVAEGETYEVLQKSTNRWKVDWSESYGSLASGYYRLAKTFTCTGDGGGESAVFYCTFRVFTQEMEPYIRKCNDTLAEILASDSWHMTLTKYLVFNYDTTADRSVKEIWRSGDDYLFMTSCYSKDGSVYRRYGSMLRDGKGYDWLHWAGDTVHSELLDWKAGDYVNSDNFDLGPSGMNIWDNLVGQICDNGNQIIAIEYLASGDDGVSDMTKEEILEQWPLAYHDYTEKTFTFDEKGNLKRIHTTVQTAPNVPEGEKVLYEVLEIHDTPTGEIAEVIAKQKLNKPKTFSYGYDYDLYKDMGKTAGFVNTDKAAMNSVDEVIDRARLETDPRKDPDYREGYVYNCSQAFYDSNLEMWKVEFWFSQDSDLKLFHHIIYLDNQGVTKLTVYPTSPEIVWDSFSWKEDYDTYSADAVHDGFRNTAVFPLTSPEDAIILAQQEADPKEHPDYEEGMTYDVVWGVYYDGVEEIWKIVLMSKDYPSVRCRVYIDKQGLTRMVHMES